MKTYVVGTHYRGTSARRFNEYHNMFSCRNIRKKLTLMSSWTWILKNNVVPDQFASEEAGSALFAIKYVNL